MTSGKNVSPPSTYAVSSWNGHHILRPIPRSVLARYYTYTHNKSRPARLLLRAGQVAGYSRPVHPRRRCHDASTDGARGTRVAVVADHPAEIRDIPETLPRAAVRPFPRVAFGTVCVVQSTSGCQEIAARGHTADHSLATVKGYLLRADLRAAGSYPLSVSLPHPRDGPQHQSTPTSSIVKTATATPTRYVDGPICHLEL